MSYPFTPDWTEAPEWANWHCVGPTGWGAWYSHMPMLDIHPVGKNQCWSTRDERDQVIAYGQVYPQHPDWRDSLRHRPEGKA